MTSEMLDIALSYMEELDCARSLSLAIMLRYSEWDQVLNLRAVPAHYSTHGAYLASAAATEFLRKLDDPSLCGIDLEAVAIEKWLWAEGECFKTNRRFNDIMDFGTLNGEPVPDAIWEFLLDCRKNVIELIGYGPPPTLLGRLGPGATVSDRSGRTTVLHKFSSVPTLTPRAIFYLFPWLGTEWGKASASRGDVVDRVRGNSFFTVPKSALTRRSCAKEPSLNVFFQLGLGQELRRRLKRQGIDLDLGQETHKSYASLASHDGSYCTIDLTSASDTVSEALVRALLPSGWYNHLADLRSPFTRVKGHWHRLEKFSSMGNGFTFELETVIFLAVCRAATRNLTFPGWDLLAYGDDIIVPSEFSREVLACLRFCGFTPNGEKTCVTGAFRESCGGDFYDGMPARAHYQKEYPNEPQQFISLANGIRRVEAQLIAGHTFFCEGRLPSPHGSGGRKPPSLWRTRHLIGSYLPTHVRACRGPEDLGDIVLHDSQERWISRWRNCIRYVRCYRPARFRGVQFGRFHPDVQFAAALYGIELMHNSRGQVHSSSELAVRDGVLGYSVGWVPFS
jgi:hypothetical protein